MSNFFVFKRVSAVFAVVFLFLLNTACKEQVEKKPDRVMPGGSVPEKLIVLDVSKDMTWADKNLLSCFQLVYYHEYNKD